MDISVLGLGLIGGSAVRALAAAGHQVTGYARRADTRGIARIAAATGTALRPAWRVAETLPEAVADADLVIVAVPLPALGSVFDQIAEARYQGLVTDVTSVKGQVRRLAAGHLPAGATFVGGHPMAGKETSGFEESESTLFHDCPWVLCLDQPDTPLPAWLGLADVITRLGARVVPSLADEHDRAVATISHVPHLVANALATGAGNDPLALALAAGSFRDGTRVAATRPELVAAMCGGNAAAVREALAVTLAELDRASAALSNPDPVAALAPLLAPGHLTRAGWPALTLPAPAEVPATLDRLLEIGRAGGWVTAVARDRGSVTAVPGTVTTEAATGARPGPAGSLDVP